ncbi:MAG TPA: hypothetical protein VG148_08650 [Pyrinomonadaceae bacterium]|nr:hypothetical protein [Pyrinomonadaceae bacterium]
MRRLLIHLAVALAAFVLGVKLAWAFGLVFGPAVKQEEVRPVYVAPAPPARLSCPTAPRVVIEAPEPPAPPAAPQPPKQTRVVIRRPDGTVQVVETQTEPARKGKF